MLRNVRENSGPEYLLLASKPAGNVARNCISTCLAIEVFSLLRYNILQSFYLFQQSKLICSIRFSMIFSEFLSQFVVIRNSSSKQLNPGIGKLGLFIHNRETSDLTKSRVKSLLSEWIIMGEEWLWLWLVLVLVLQ